MSLTLGRLMLRALGMGAALFVLCAGGAVWFPQQAPHLLLAYKSDHRSATSSQIYILDTTTRHRVRLAPSLYDQSHPAWEWSMASRSTSRLGFSSYPAPLHLVMMELMGRERESVNPEAVDDEYQLAFAPDGRIAAATNERITWDIVLYANTIPATRTLPTFNSDANDLEPSWCDDQRLVFTSNRNNNVEDGSHDIYLYDFSADTLTNLTDHVAEDYNPSCWVGAGDTGAWIAFTSTREYNAEVYVMSLVTGETYNVTNHRGQEFNPAWLPDGRLSFVSDRDGNREIYVLDLATRELVNVTRSAADDDQPAWSH